MKLTGAAASTALVAGCSSGGDGDDGGDGSGDGDSGGETYTIESGTEILFRAENMSWHGKNPSDIEDVENPTIELTEGETYTIGWDEGDDSGHNFEIWNDNEEIVEDYTTDTVSEPGDSQVYEIEVTSEMAEYVCDPHSTSGMRGTIETTSGDGGDGGDSGNESNESSE